MNTDEQIQALVASMHAMREQIRNKDESWREEMRVKDEAWRAEWQASMQELREHMRVNHDSLHANLGELFESMQQHDAQIAANSSQIAQLIMAARQDAEAIRALARIAEPHERRITGLEGGEQ